LHDPQKNVLIFKALDSAKSNEKFPESFSGVERGMTGHVFRKRRPLLSANVKNEPQFYYSLFPDAVSKIVVPLLYKEQRAKQECFGVLAVEGDHEAQFDLETQELLTTLARHASIALAQARHVHVVRSDYEQILKEFRFAQDAMGVRTILHDSKNFVRSVVHELETILDELRERHLAKRFAKELEKRLNKLRDISDLMKLLLIQLKGPVPERGDITSEETVVDLGQMALRVINVIPLADAEVDISLEAEQEPHMVYGKATQLLLVLYNLLTNAVAAIKRTSQPGKITISLSDTPKRPGFCRLQVEDNGPGLPRPVREFINKGEMFSETVGGTGLGLLTVRETVRDLGGAIDVYSRYGDGTRFTIDLPKPKD
jgi:signal transduction histidine kinase